MSKLNRANKFMDREDKIFWHFLSFILTNWWLLARYIFLLHVWDSMFCNSCLEERSGMGEKGSYKT